MSRGPSKVFVAMSGGVDSSVAAALLKKQGYQVVGVYIKCFNLDGCGTRDAEDARRVAEQINIPFYVFDLEKDYKEKVVRYMIDGYKRGITPNPDIMCNKEIKFGLFLKKALELGADYIATGHYAKLTRRPNSFILRSQDKRKCYGLLRAKDKNKDQSYFLWTLTQKQLKHCLFPIGEYTKPQVRKLAKKFGLITFDKKDSQGICFLGKVNTIDFLKQYIPERGGDIVNTSGQKIGGHKGAYFYTIGQRHGLKIGGTAKPLYVVNKNVKNNTLIVAEGKNNPALYKKNIQLTNINFISKESVAYARVRYRQPLIRAKLMKNKLVFTKPQKFIAPGQSAVFYSKIGELLGGGVIL